jgi:putative membrane protein
MLFGPIIWILLIGLLVWLAIGIFRRYDPADRRGATSSKSPREIIDERYARGEIDEEEYRHRRSVLER